MNEYLVYITCGGLMEDPGWHDEDHKVISADSIDEAVDKWFPLSQCHDRKFLRKEEDGEWTYWGWRITVRKLV